MSKLGETISKALAEIEKLQKTIEGMTDSDFKDQQKRLAQKLKGILTKAAAREEQPYLEPNIHEC
jgi:uncharacterized protein YukE